MKKIRNYNCARAFASIRANVTTPPGKGPYCCRIHAMGYHTTSSVGQDSRNPRYANLYFMDLAQATNIRLHNEANAGCERWVMIALDTMLREINPYAHLYKSMRRLFEEEQRNAVAENRDQFAVAMLIYNDKTQDQRRYNNPTNNEIGVVFKSVDGAPPSDRDIRGHLLIPPRGRRFIEIDPNKSMCDPTSYPLLFPSGDSGWNPNILYRTNDERREAEGENDEEEDPDVVSNERGPGGETATEEAENQELNFEETVGDPEDQSISRRRGNEILQTIIFLLFINKCAF
jgi:hypothetical protein